MGLIKQAHSHAVIYSCRSQNDISTGACLARLHNAWGGGWTLYSGLCGEAPHKGGAIFKLAVIKEGSQIAILE